MAPKISVIMAVYNKAAYLNESIESVLNQNFRDYELICVDANSTDESLNILKEYANKDPRIKLYSTPYTPVPAETKNYGLEHSTGEYVFLLDADDYLSPNLLQHVYLTAHNSNADAVLPDLHTFSEKGTIKEQRIGLNGNRDTLLTGRQAVTESLDWTIHAFALWRGSLIRELRFEEFGTFSDEYSSRLLFNNCHKVAFCEGTYFYRQYPESITGKVSLKLYDRPYMLCRLAEFLEKNGFDEKNVCSLHFSAFKDCCFLMHLKSKLPSNERAAAEQKIKEAFSKIDKQKVRKNVYAFEPGRAAIWRVQGKVKKHYFAALSVANWGVFKEFSKRWFFW
ncbi:MAG: glycosyltransferase family 2 protein [Candidatus Bathyarchaeia archaeon]